MFERILSLVVERLMVWLAKFLRAWIDRERKKEQSKKKAKDNAEDLKRAKDEKEKRDALDRIADDFAD